MTKGFFRRIRIVQIENIGDDFFSNLSIGICCKIEIEKVGRLTRFRRMDSLK